MKRLALLLIACCLLTESPAEESQPAAVAEASESPQKLTPEEALLFLQSQNFFNTRFCILGQEESFNKLAAEFENNIRFPEEEPTELQNYPWLLKLMHMAWLNHSACLIRPEILQCFLAQTKDIHAVDESGMNAMDYAIRASAHILFKPLTDAGLKANLTRQDNIGMTAIMHAMDDGAEETVAALLEQGNFIDDFNEDGESLLAMALKGGNRNMVEQLLRKGAKVHTEMEDDYGCTLLYHACDGGISEFVQQLLQSGAKVNTASESGMTPLMIAAQSGHAEIVRILLKHGANNKLTDEEGNSALHHAILSNHTECVRILLDAENRQKSKSDKLSQYLDTAMENGSLEVAEFLLQHGAVFDAEQHGWSYLCAALRKQHEPLLNLLEHAGAQYDSLTPDDEGVTQLMLAAENAFPELVERFLEEGADIHTTDNDGMSVMTYALRGGDRDIVRMLKNAGTQLNTKEVTPDGETQLILAARHGLTEEVRELLQHRAPLNHRSDEGKTALMEAMQQGHSAVVAALLKAGSKIRTRHTPGALTPLMCAAQGGLVSSVRMLLKTGSKPNDVIFPYISEELPGGTTALMLAAEHGHESIVQLLLKSGALPHLQNENGHTAADLARENGHTKLADYLNSLP